MRFDAIASAAVESAHHGVVQRRLKRPGQLWTVRGAQQILAARRLWCNRDSPADVTSVAEVAASRGPRLSAPGRDGGMSVTNLASALSGKEIDSGDEVVRA